MESHWTLPRIISWLVAGGYALGVGWIGIYLLTCSNTFPCPSQKGPLIVPLFFLLLATAIVYALCRALLEMIAWMVNGFIGFVRSLLG
jgi:hypothetical protein